MALTQFDPMWKVMEKYKLVFSDQGLHDSLLCVICKKVMNNAVVSTICGCQYCYGCISGYINGEDKYCPGGKDDCEVEHIRVDKNAVKSFMLTRKISKLKVECPSESCEFCVELLEMDNHLRLCNKQSTDCPYVVIGCTSERVNKDKMLAHLNTEAMTHSELLIELITYLKNEVAGLKEDSEKSKLEMAFLKDELIAKENRIAKLENEKATNEAFENMNNAVDDLTKDVKDLLQKNNLEIVALKEQLGEKENRIVELNGQYMELRMEVETKVNVERDKRENEIEEQRKKTEDAIIKGENVARMVHVATEDMKIMREERIIEDREKDARMNRWIKLNKLCPILAATFAWKFDEISKKIDKPVFSDSFYSNNYKLCIGLHIFGGDNFGLWCNIMRGEYDGALVWPMKRGVTLSIIDINTAKSHKSLTYQTSFDKPTNDRCAAVGGFLINYSSIKDNPWIIANDSIIVSCVV